MEAHEHPNYARIEDIVYTNELLDSTVSRLNYAEHEYGLAIAELRASVGTISTSDNFLSMYTELREEIDSIKGAIIEIQDSLRQLGMDDIRNRLGDIQVLFT